MTVRRGRGEPGEDVVVCAPVSVPYERYSDRSAHYWFGRALAAVCASAGVHPSELDGLAAASMTLGPDTPVALVEHLGLRLSWLEHLTVGGASGVVALRRAVTAVAAGDAQMIACVGADTHQRGGFAPLIENFSQFSRDAVYPYGAGGPNASFALITQAFMRATGITSQELGKLCVSSRENASHNPQALLRERISLDEYADSRMIADPIKLLDCVMPCAGAEAFLVTTRARARALGIPAVVVLSSFESYNDDPEAAVQTSGGWARHAPSMWARSGVGPHEVDVVHTYDDYPVMVAMQLRDLGFSGNDIGAFIRDNTFTTGGSLPHNTSGGQISSGQAGFAGGFLGVTEVVRQLTGRPLGAEVTDARVGVVSGFGMITYDRGLVAAAAVLERADA